MLKQHNLKDAHFKGIKRTCSEDSPIVEELVSLEPHFEQWYRCEECGAEQEEDSACKDCGCEGVVWFQRKVGE